MIGKRLSEIYESRDKQLKIRFLDMEKSLKDNELSPPHRAARLYRVNQNFLQILNLFFRSFLDLRILVVKVG